MSATRRDRVVMVLGLAALLLFAANLISFVQKQFFHRHHEVHYVEAVPKVDAHAIVVAPRVHSRAFSFRIHDEALDRASARLAEEVARLSAESARLSADGHGDAAASLSETVVELQAKLERLRVEAEEARRHMEFEVQLQMQQEVEAATRGADETGIEHIVVTTTDASPSPVVVSESPVEVTVVRAGSNR